MKKTLRNILLAITTLLPSLALAISETDVPGVGLVDTSTGIRAVIVNVVNIFLGFSAALATLFIIIGGIMYITSSGNEDTVGKAKSILTYSAVGLLIIVSSLVIVRLTLRTSSIACPKGQVVEGTYAERGPGVDVNGDGKVGCVAGRAE